MHLARPGSRGSPERSSTTGSRRSPAALSGTDAIGPDDLPERLLARDEPPGSPDGAADASLEEVEKRHVARVLSESATLEEAAARLGVHVTTLWRKRKRYRLDW